MKYSVLLSLLIPVIFLLACTSEEISQEEALSEEELSTGEAAIFSGETLCTPGWKCLGKWNKAYQDKNCSWSQKIECPLGCQNGECQAGQTCDSGFRCINENKMGFQTEGCTWINIKNCLGGCENGACLPDPIQNETTAEEPAEPVEPITPPLIEYEILNFGEKKIYQINSQEYTITLYNLESDRAKFRINEWKTEWMVENATINYQGEFIIHLQEILFQPYDGGVKQVSFTIE